MLPTLTEAEAHRLICPFRQRGVEVKIGHDGGEYTETPEEKCIGRRCASWRFVDAAPIQGGFQLTAGDDGEHLGMEHEGLCLANSLVLNFVTVTPPVPPGRVLRP